MNVAFCMLFPSAELTLFIWRSACWWVLLYPRIWTGTFKNSYHLHNDFPTNLKLPRRLFRWKRLFRWSNSLSNRNSTWIKVVCNLEYYQLRWHMSFRRCQLRTRLLASSRNAPQNMMESTNWNIYKSNWQIENKSEHKCVFSNLVTYSMFEWNVLIKDKNISISSVRTVPLILTLRKNYRNRSSFLLMCRT